MSLPRDLDELEDSEIIVELSRRVKCAKDGVCSYCSRPLDSEPPCKMRKHHSSTDDEEPEPGFDEDHMIRVSGKIFRCPCGCNVFRKPKPVSKPGLYVCNSCSDAWLGE